jgi:hypothetical protein
MHITLTPHSGSVLVWFLSGDTSNKFHFELKFIWNSRSPIQNTDRRHPFSGVCQCLAATGFLAMPRQPQRVYKAVPTFIRC